MQLGPAEHHVEHAEERDHRVERILAVRPLPEAARELAREPPDGETPAAASQRTRALHASLRERGSRFDTRKIPRRRYVSAG